MSIESYVTKLLNYQLLTSSQVHHLTRSVIEIFIQEPNILQLDQSEHFIIGDIHGQYYDLLNLLKNIIPKVGQKSYVFLGDYVDRGYNSIQTICLLLTYKCLYRDKITMLRGNHQTSSLTKIYGFYDEVQKKYGTSEVWSYIVQVFQYLPLAAIVQNKIMCVHGGLSPNTPMLQNIAAINRVQQIPQAGPLGDLVWSDPDSNVKSWTVSNRGAGYLFPHEAVKQFLFINDLNTIARAHQLVEEGHLYNFGDQSLVTVWSAPNYCYRCGNKASVMRVGEAGKIDFIQFGASDQNKKMNISCEYVLPYFL